MGSAHLLEPASAADVIDLSDPESPDRLIQTDKANLHSQISSIAPAGRHLRGTVAPFPCLAVRAVLQQLDRCHGARLIARDGRCRGRQSEQ